MLVIKYVEDKEKQNEKINPQNLETAYILVCSFASLTLTPKKPTLKLSYSHQAKKPKVCLLDLRKQEFCAFESEVINKKDSVQWNARTQPAT